MRASVAVDRAMICRSTTHKRRCEHSHTATSNAQMGKCGKVPTDSTLTPQLSRTHAEPHVKEKVVAHTQLMSLSLNLFSRPETEGRMAVTGEAWSCAGESR